MQVFDVLSSPVRFKIVKILLNREGAVCVCELEEHFDKDQSVLYRHIKKIERSGLISSYKDGRKLMFEIKNREALEKFIEAVEELDSTINNRKQKAKVNN